MKKIFAVIAIIALLFTGCVNNNANTSDSTTVSEATEFIELKTWETELLLQIYTSGRDSSNITSGTLNEEQLKTLGCLQGLMNHLNSRYSGHTFSIESADKIEAAAGYTHIFFMFTADGNEKLFSAEVYGKDTMTYKDNYYATVVRPQYDKVLKDALSSRGIDVVAIETDFTEMYAMGDIGIAEFNTEALLMSGSELPRETSVYIKTNSPKEDLRVAKSAIEKMNIYGSFRVYGSEKFKADMDISECRNVWAENQSEVNTISFQCEIKK